MASLPLINQAFEKKKENGSLTDEELVKSLAKSGMVIPEDRFNKILLDLEILGKIRVSWLTKDTRRIEAITEEEIDEVDLQNKESMEK
ncbi:MAG: hypothetical protein WD154_07130, partial [Nitrosopumilaceae archaeon]